MSEVYRLKVGIANSGNGGSGSWRYFEELDELSADLLAAHIDMLAVARRGITAWMARLWRGDKPAYPRVSSVYAVERHTDNGWMPVEYRVVEPAVVFEWAAKNGATHD